MDYKLLLKKYIELVAGVEGTTFIMSLYRENSNIIFTKD
jgi:hypothetical protein